MDKTFHEKVLAVQSDLKAPKDKENKFGGYKYRSCEGILQAVKPLLAREGLILTITDEIVQIGERFYVKATATVRGDAISDWMCATAYAREADNKKGMDPAQVTGATSSYARKYALNGLFGIDDAKDPDTDEYQKQTRAKKEKEPEEISFGTASAEDSNLPFDVGEPETAADEPIELRGLRSLMKMDGVTEEQILEAFKGRYSAIENIEPEVIQTKLLDKWQSFITFIKGGTKS